MKSVNLWLYLTTWGLYNCCQMELEEAYLLFVPWVELATWPHQDTGRLGNTGSTGISGDTHIYSHSSVLHSASVVMFAFAFASN